MRVDETWQRLLQWTQGQAPSERLAAILLAHEGFSEIDPSHPLGGKDGGRDAFCVKEGIRFVEGVYFPRGQQDFSAIRTKVADDLESAKRHAVGGFVFVTNQELRLGERAELAKLTSTRFELLHLERITLILDLPQMAQVRKQFLDIDWSDATIGAGGSGGGGTILGDRGTVIAGRGGSGGVSGSGGHGGSGFILGDDGLIVGGDGGDAATADGRGGRGAVGPLERANGPTHLWPIGRGGVGANDPEYDRRLMILKRLRAEYADAFPERVPFIDAGVDQVPVAWINKRLEETGEPWRVEMGPVGYVLPPLSA